MTREDQIRRDAVDRLDETIRESRRLTRALHELESADPSVRLIEPADEPYARPKPDRRNRS
jgi:hypothetical protein